MNGGNFPNRKGQKRKQALAWRERDLQNTIKYQSRDKTDEQKKATAARIKELNVEIAKLKFRVSMAGTPECEIRKAEKAKAGPAQKEQKQP